MKNEEIELNKTKKVREIWNNMKRRCYNQNLKNRCPTYKDVTCCEEWNKFEPFQEWILSQPNFDILEKSNERCNLDKDILIKGNKIYSPNTCTLVPDSLNSMIGNMNRVDGLYSMGTHYDVRTKRYFAECATDNGNVHIGSFISEFEAFEAYKEFKENYIKKKAREAYDLKYITEECFNALNKYTVDNNKLDFTDNRKRKFRVVKTRIIMRDYYINVDASSEEEAKKITDSLTWRDFETVKRAGINSDTFEDNNIKCIGNASS